MLCHWGFQKTPCTCTNLLCVLKTWHDMCQKSFSPAQRLYQEFSYPCNSYDYTFCHFVFTLRDSNSGWVVAGGLLVKALDHGSKGPGFLSHLQQRFISLWVHSVKGFPSHPLEGTLSRRSLIISLSAIGISLSSGSSQHIKKKVLL